MIKEGKLKRGEQADKDDAEGDTSDGLEPDEKVKKKSPRKGLKSGLGIAKSAAQKLSPKIVPKRKKAKVAMLKVYPNELEAQPEFEGFNEWLQTFELYRGKQREEVFEDESRIVGKFKASTLKIIFFSMGLQDST